MTIIFYFLFGTGSVSEMQEQNKHFMQGLRNRELRFFPVTALVDLLLLIWFGCF